MATYITVEAQPGQALLDASRRQTLANRVNLLPKPAPAAAPATTSRPVGRSRRAVIPSDELAAFRRLGLQVARGFLSFSIGGLTIYCGDKSTSESISFPQIAAPLRDPAVPQPLPIIGPNDWYSAGMPEDWRQVQAYAYRVEGRIFLALPLSAEVFVLYAGAWDYRAIHYLDAFISRFNSTSGPVIGIVPKVTDQRGVTTQAQDILNACFLVSRSTVRQITAPAALINVVSSIYQPVVDIGSITSSAGTETLYFDTIYNTPIAVATPLPGYDYSWTVPSRQSSSAYQAYLASLATVLNPQLAFGYGLGSLLATPQDLYAVFTPAVYSALQKGAIIRSATDQSQFDSYAYVDGTFVQGLPFPGRFVDTGIDSDQPRRRYRLTTQRPVDLQTPVPEVNLRPSGAKPVTEDPNFTVPILHAWDWGRPAYCRQQLLALGFTAADLTP